MQLLLILLSSIRPYSSVDKELLSLIHQGFSAKKFFSFNAQQNQSCRETVVQKLKQTRETNVE